ncbi:BRCT domain-containing protein [Colwellia sp. Bg11-28]|uniref:BRCT domain-containing protein n=1 Tax=Colwellia sp. Bg11-28 TaxID=2058305 RepID=UPI000C32DD79|nr:BRCT domain-containing protein [Colwellia sp. Bg11-28]PKH86871.1 DNA ligase [Colwellia sp. Bg11-28]
MLNEIQKEIFSKKHEKLHLSLLIEVLEGIVEFKSLNEEFQLEILEITNACYRAKHELINDRVYDGFQEIFKESNELGEYHPYLTNVESEDVLEGKTVELPQRMLSTQKAYTFKSINKWLDNVIKTGNMVDISELDIEIRITPKLDGYAGYDDGSTLYTRGNGVRGRDISFAFERGLQVAKSAQRGLGAGEIVISKDYFESNLSKYFENSRNIQASIIAEKNIDKRVQKAMNEGAAVFYPFSKLENWEGKISDLRSDFDAITQNILASCDYDVDGVVLECKNQKIKEKMGATRKHHRWQIALKSNDEKAQVEVLEVIPQTSRNGKLTPVVRINPTKLSGAEISRVTAHHYGMVRDKKIGKGAILEIVRSGLVIPKIEKVIESANADIPDVCPCCNEDLKWVDDSLYCLNTSACKDQIEKSIIHFFDTLGNNDGFGTATISNLNKHGVSTIYDVYLLENNSIKLSELGYKEKTVKNLQDALTRSRTVEIEDWRFLAAFGLNRLGLGVAENLLEHHSIESIFDLDTKELVKIDGFAKKTAIQLVKGLSSIKDVFQKIYSLHFNLTVTPKKSDQLDSNSPIAGKIVVFTGAMTQGARGDMEKQAKLLGAKVGKSVSGKTDFLITGEKVGENKLNAARDKGVKVLSEEEYLSLIND